jgi:hypothetical protein
VLNLALRNALYFLVRDWRERYPNAISVLGEVFGLGLSLGIYWFTARAFAGHADFAGQGYFSFVVLGEASLVLPLALVAGLPRTAREAQAEGVLEALLSLPRSAVRTLLILGFPGVLREAARSVTLLLGAWVLGLGLGLPQFGGWLLLELAALPAFAAIGITATAWYLKFGRGEGLVAFSSSIAVILAGAYFPTELFGPALREGLSATSPFNVLLEGARGVLAQGGSAMQVQAVGHLLLWGALGLPLAVACFGLSLRAVRRRGSFEITT